MTYALNATACPAVQFRSAFLSITGMAPPVSQAFVTGDTAAVLTKQGQNAVRQDLVGCYGGGAYFVAQGLTLAAGTGLNVTIAPGTAMIGGPVDVETTYTLAVTGSLTNAFVWLPASGIPTYTTTTTPPAGAQCLLGNVTTSGSAVTAVDYSGVLYNAGMLHRFTADAGKPTDTPPGLYFLTTTAGGTYLWLGSAYITLPGT